MLGRSASTVSWEVGRNGGYDAYRAAVADGRAWAKARRPRRCKLAENRRLAQTVAVKLRRNWSPEQIAGWLKRTYAGDEAYQVSHETIYRSLFVQTRGAWEAHRITAGGTYTLSNLKAMCQTCHRNAPGYVGVV